MISKNNVDYLVIGAGAAGLQLGYFLEKAKLNYLILEAGSGAGTFFKQYPRHRKLISINKVYTGYKDSEINLRWDWNSLINREGEILVKNYTKKYFPHADDYVNYLNDFANHYHLKVKYGVKVAKIFKTGQFTVIDRQDNIYTARRLIMATGVSKPYIPPIPGIELTEDYTKVSVNPEDFIDRQVLIIGKGNSAFETADNLIETAAVIHLASPSPVNMAWKTHYVGHLRAVNNNVLDTYQLKSQNAILDATVVEIKRQDRGFAVVFDYSHAHGEREELYYDRVITCTGFRFDNEIFDRSCRPALTINDRFPAQTSEWESVNIKDLYFAGTIMQMRDYKKTTSGFIHGFRYNIEFLARLFEQKYHHKPLSSLPVSPTAEAIADKIIQRVNQTSALWQQFGFLCDSIVISQSRATANYYQNIPVDYIHDGELGQSEDYYLLTLEYGADHDQSDPFNVTRIERHDAERANQSQFLHPVIRHFNKSQLVSEHHIIEDLAAEWLEEVHIAPLKQYLEAELAGVTKQVAMSK